MVGDRLLLRFIPASSTSANAALLLATALIALLVILLWVRSRNYARKAIYWRRQARHLYEFTRRTQEMNLHLEPGPQLAELVFEIFALEAVAVFDAELHQVYPAGY